MFTKVRLHHMHLLCLFLVCSRQDDAPGHGNVLDWYMGWWRNEDMWRLGTW